MCAVQLVRVLVHARISAATEDFLLQMEKEEEPALRALLTERLTAAAEEIVGLFEETVAEYEDRVQREICLQRTLLDAVLKQPVVRLHRAVWSASTQLLSVSTEGALAKQQELSTVLHQDDPKPTHIKEEQEEPWSKQEGEQPEGLEETGFTLVPVKREDGEKPWSSHFHQTDTVDHREDCEGSEPARNSGPGGILGPVSKDGYFDSSETDDSDWTPSCEAHLVIKDVRSTKAPEAEIGKSVKERYWSCSYCGKRFKQKGNLKKHIRIHTGERPYPCTSCDKAFSAKTVLTMHTMCHTGEKPFTCAVCNRSYRYKYNLNVHMRLHTGEKLISCSVCGKGFTHMGSLNRHMSSHTKERLFPCTVCDKSFKSKWSLASHMKYHIEKKQLTCAVCNKRVTDLKRHVRIHTTEKPFSCPSCGMCFAVKSTLTKHMGIHTGDKKFSCKTCGKCFPLRGNLKQYMKIHAAECKVTKSAETAQVSGHQVEQKWTPMNC